MLGYGRKENIIYLIDFGLSKKTSEFAYSGFSKVGGKKLAGTPIYASVNAHLATGSNVPSNHSHTCRVIFQRWLRVNDVCHHTTDQRFFTLVEYKMSGWWI